MLLGAMILTSSLCGCYDENQPPPAAAAAAVQEVLAQPTAESRKAAIQRALAPVCPIPLSDDDLEAVAAFVEAHRDKGSIAVTNMVLRLDGEARICRGMKVTN